MEPVTHVLTGACLSRTGLNRRAAYATAAMAIAAEFPDIDTLWSLRGSVEGFQHHRGITHTFLGIPFEATLLLLGFYLYDRWRASRAINLAAKARQPDRAPVNWVWLYGLLLLALLSHILLDFTNNYGVRPFFPIVNRWYAASIVFIFDPLIFLCLTAGLAMPALFGLIGQEVGARKEFYRGRGWARAALIAVALLWGVRYAEHDRAVTLAQQQTLRAPAEQTADAEPARSASLSGSSTPAPQQKSNGEDPDEARLLLMAQRSLASPDPLSVFRWYTATDFGPAYRLGVADTRQDTLSSGALLVLAKPDASIKTAEESALGRAYLDWSTLPYLSVTQGRPPDLVDDASPGAPATTVTFSDPRFMGELSFLQRGDRPPLTGTVVIDGKGQVIAQGMDGRLSH